MAHKKGQGSSSNGRDSNPQYLGVKVSDGQWVSTSSIIVRQRGSKFHLGKNTYFGSDWTLHASVDGFVRFQGSKVWVEPAANDCRSRQLFIETTELRKNDATAQRSGKEGHTARSQSSTHERSDYPTNTATIERSARHERQPTSKTETSAKAPQPDRSNVKKPDGEFFSAGLITGDVFDVVQRRTKTSEVSGTRATPAGSGGDETGGISPPPVDTFVRFAVRAKGDHSPKEYTTRAAFFAERFSSAFDEVFKRLRMIPEAKFDLMTSSDADEALEMWERLIPSERRTESDSNDVIQVLPDILTLELLLDCEHDFANRVASVLDYDSITIKQTRIDGGPLIPIRLASSSTTFSASRALRDCVEGEHLSSYKEVCEKQRSLSNDADERLNRRLVIIDSGFDPQHAAKSLGGISLEQIRFFEWSQSKWQTSLKKRVQGRLRRINSPESWKDLHRSENEDRGFHGTTMAVRAVGDDGIYPGAPLTVVKAFGWGRAAKQEFSRSKEALVLHYETFASLMAQVFGGHIRDIGVVNMSFTVSPSNLEPFTSEMKEHVESLTNRFNEIMANARTFHPELRSKRERIWIVAAVQNDCENFVEWPAASNHVLGVGIHSEKQVTSASGRAYETLSEYEKMLNEDAAVGDRRFKPDVVAIGHPPFAAGPSTSFAAAAVSAKLLYLIHHGTDVDEILKYIEEDKANYAVFDRHHGQCVAVFRFPVEL